MSILPEKFTSGYYEFHNYTILGKDEHKLIVEMRNKYRHLAHDTSELTLKEHLEFINKLKKLKNRAYYCVKSKQNENLFSVNIQDIDLDNKKCNWGFFKIADCNSRAVLRCFLDYLAVFTPICTVTGYVRNDNVKSILIHKDLGFEIVEVFDELEETLFMKKLKDF